MMVRVRGSPTLTLASPTWRWWLPGAVVLQAREGDDRAACAAAALRDARLQREELVLACLPRAGVAAAAVTLAVGVAAVASKRHAFRGARRSERDRARAARAVGAAQQAGAGGVVQDDVARGIAAVDRVVGSNWVDPAPSSRDDEH